MRRLAVPGFSFDDTLLMCHVATSLLSVHHVHRRVVVTAHVLPIRTEMLFSVTCCVEMLLSATSLPA